MARKLEVLAIIGARSGSKGVPNKNIKLLSGKPLMAWIIEAAHASRFVRRVVVSTDSRRYQEVAKEYGAETPFLRPAEFATDLSPEYEYVRHAVDWLASHEDYRPDLIVRMFPTVPLQQPSDVDGAVEALLKEEDADSAVVIAEARQHPEKALKLVPDGAGSYKLVTYATESSRDVTPIGRQNYPKAYFRANIIVSRLQTIIKKNSLTGDFVRYYEIPQERAIDIDSILDFYIVESLMARGILPRNRGTPKRTRRAR